MPELTFPFFIVSEPHAGMMRPVGKSPGYVAAFSTVKKAFAFILEGRGDDWRMTLVSRPTYDAMVASLRRLGVKGMILAGGENDDATVVEFDVTQN